jgi:hypothetical protein
MMPALQKEELSFRVPGTELLAQPALSVETIA